MALLDKILGRNKTLSDLSPQELRKEEILIGRQREKLVKKIETISTAKQKIFQQGAAQKSPELRKALAQDFELKTQEQLMSSRELNLRSKELLTVSRLRMVKENQGKSAALGRLKVTDRDVAKINGMIEDDSITQEMYTERLDSILDTGLAADKDALGSATVGEAGQELLDIWNQIDRGSMKQEAAFDKADAAVRQRQASRENL